MRLKLSIIAISCLLTAGLNAADDSALQGALTGGTVSGEFVLHAERQNNSGANVDNAFSMGSFGLGYETKDYYGFKLNVGVRTNHMFDEKQDGDYSGGASV
jgi:hypothetical protein